MKRAIFVAVFLLLGTASAEAQTRWPIDTTCLRLYLQAAPPNPKLDSVTNAQFNPDSVMIDTCNLAIADTWIKRGINFNFDDVKKSIRLPWAPAKSILEVPWTVIDTSLHEIRSAFQKIYDSVGPYMIRKPYPEDTIGIGSISYEFRFFTYTPVDSALRYLEGVPGLNWSNSIPQVPFGWQWNSVNSSPNEKQISVYPQPASKEFFVNFDGISAVESKPLIFDELGRQVLDISLHQDEGDRFRFDVSRLSAGLYFLRWGSYTARFVVTTGR